MSSFLSRWSWFSFHEYFLNSLKESVYRELAHLEDINPVQCAVFFGSDKLIEYLISQEMLDFGQKDSAGNSLLTYAALSEKTHVADILVKTGQFDIDHRNNQGHTILQLCANQGKFLFAVEVLNQFMRKKQSLRKNKVVQVSAQKRR